MPVYEGTPLESDYERIKRRREIAKALRERSMAPYTPQVVSGRVVPYGIGEGLTQLGEAWLGSKSEEAAKKEEKALEKRYETESGAYTQKVMDALFGREQTGQPQAGGPLLSQEGQEYQPYQPATPDYQPAVEEDPMRAALLAEKDPYRKGKGGVMEAIIKTKLGKAAKPSYKVVPERIAGDMWQNREIIDGQKAGLVGEPYKKGAGAADVTAKAEAKGYNKYAEQRLKGQAVRMDDLAKSAKSAYNESQALDRFITASAKGTAGGAQPVISGVKNFLASFGYTDEALTSVRTMEQAVGDMKVNKIAQFGARGLTDKDMEVIHQSLPRVSTDKNSRVAIAQILKKLHDREINDYVYALEQEQQLHPGVAKQIIKPRWLKEYGLQQSPGEVDPEVWKVMTPEERKLWQ